MYTSDSGTNIDQNVRICSFVHLFIYSFIHEYERSLRAADYSTVKLY